jgi:hypothetical protein
MPIQVIELNKRFVSLVSSLQASASKESFGRFYDNVATGGSVGVFELAQKHPLRK